jgi:hypothetical protein
LPSELSPEERLKPYSKYFYLPPAAPAPEKLAALERPLDPALALPVEQLNDLLNPGYLPAEAGWCILPSGAAYVSNITAMPGVTVEMINWWFAWHGLEGLRYKIWFPPAHLAISVSDTDRARILDPAVPLTGKFQGLTHHVVENVGGGPENITIHFLTPADAGFDMTRFHAPFIGTVVAANGLSAPVDGSHPPAPAFMCHAVREIPGGVELRTRFWMGYHMIERQPRLLLPPGIRIPDFVPHGLAVHNVHEYTNLAALLLRIYPEQRASGF